MVQTEDRFLNSARLIGFSPVPLQGATNQICLIQRDMSQTSHDIGKALSFELLICVRNARSDFVPDCIESTLGTGDIDRITQRRKRHDRTIIGTADGTT